MTIEELQVWLNLQTNPNVKGELFVDRRSEVHLKYLPLYNFSPHSYGII